VMSPSFRMRRDDGAGRSTGSWAGRTGRNGSVTRRRDNDRGASTMFITKRSISRRAILRGIGRDLDVAVPRRDAAGLDGGSGADAALRGHIRTARRAARLLGAGHDRG
jgi:hypothetical protein